MTEQRWPWMQLTKDSDHEGAESRYFPAGERRPTDSPVFLTLVASSNPS
jgi:hypothetical protein